MNVYTPKPGFEWNPLRAFRNVACPCGSEKKAKRCHGQADLLPASDVATIKRYLRHLSAMGVIEARPKDIQ